MSTKPQTPKTTTKKPPAPVKKVASPSVSIVPGAANTKDKSQMNIVDWAAQVAANPNQAMVKNNPKTTGTNESMYLSDHAKDAQNTMSAAEIKSGEVNGAASQFQMDADKLDIDNEEVANVDPTQANSYDVKTTAEDVAAQDMQGAQGQVSDGAIISDDEVAQTDIDQMMNDPNSELAKALKDYAKQNMSNVIDTSTREGKELAEALGDGNYIDSKATLQGQLALLQSQFVDPVTGEPKIPSWAAGTARNVGKIAAFSGMTGTAATMAMSQALMEASLPIAQADSQFFQTITLQNLSNKQQSTINTANVLAKFQEQNVDNRMAAAIQNSKAFLEMDMANLSNEQQAAVINNQNRVQSILEDAKQENAKRLFVAENQNDLDKFYAELNTQINQFNSTQSLDADKFNSTMEDSREKFYKEMQYNIAISNAKWRQTVQLQEDQQAFEAATTDVKNMMDMSINQLNQLWDRSDSLLDYIWKSAENEKDRQNKLAQVKLGGKISKDNATLGAIGTLAGTFIGSEAGSNLISKGVKAIFG